MSPSITLCSAWQSRHYCDPAQVIKVHFSFLAALLPWKDQRIHKRCMNCLGQSKGCRMPIWEQFKQLVRNLAYPRNGIDVLPYVVCITSAAAMHCFDTVWKKNEIICCVFWHLNTVLIHRYISHSELHNYIGWIFKWN